MPCPECQSNTASAASATDAATKEGGRCAACAPAAPVSPPQPPAPTWAGLRSPIGLSRAAAALLWAVIAADVCALLASVNLRRLAVAMTDGEASAISEQEAELADLMMVGTSLFQVLATLAATVLFIIWFFRVRKNAGVFAPGLMTRGPGWAIGAWFIPIANLWLPRGIAVETWRASRPDAHAPDHSQPHTSLNLWWTAWVVTLVFGRYASRIYDRAETAEEIRHAAGLAAVSCLLDIVAAVLAVLFVRRLTAMQHAKALRGPRSANDPAMV
ncbi:DUF4328 domain-containing protein [Streptomyces sp. HNM0663]|uniref:DUF4328 domain-containing protein n=1 Tax=Streptomyces chengmaiensis TaxID=3040919 RepID=A0ABT6HTD4_9ACTN|nr:DUF4328 domain-containing protein [Streptomyces chengmaiensis]MDH2391835.1 DUF4328 domain-containing protein [Streptomyces chengmaiensis]